MGPKGTTPSDLRDTISAFIDVRERERVPSDAARGKICFAPALRKLLKQEPYLGSTMTSSGTAFAEVTARIAKAGHAFHKLALVWRSKALLQKTKFR